MTREQLVALVRPLEQAGIAYDLAFPPSTGLLRVTSIAPGHLHLRRINGGVGDCWLTADELKG